MYMARHIDIKNVNVHKIAELELKRLGLKKLCIISLWILFLNANIDC